MAKNVFFIITPPRRAVPYIAAIAVIVTILAAIVWTGGTVSPTVDDTASSTGPLKRCVVCHSVTQGGGLRVGPPLYGIVGAPKARTAWYGYSLTLKTAGGVWSEEDLDAFLASPSKYLPGTTMTIVGIPDPKERADIIAALKEGH